MLVDEAKNFASKLSILCEMVFGVRRLCDIPASICNSSLNMCISFTLALTPSLACPLGEYIDKKLIIYHNQLCIRMSARQHLCLNALSYGDWLHCYTYTSVRYDFRSALLVVSICVLVRFFFCLRALHFTFSFSVHDLCGQLNKTQGFQSNNPISSDQYYISQCSICITICIVNMYESLRLPSDFRFDEVQSMQTPH